MLYLIYIAYYNLFIPKKYTILNDNSCAIKIVLNYHKFGVDISIICNIMENTKNIMKGGVSYEVF